jgi:RecA/RadA recombinase
MSSFLKSLIKDVGSDYASLAADIDEDESFVSTGSYIFNALVSGSIYGGISGNKITAIAGESSTGKTFFALAVVKHFLDSDPNAIVVYYDTESAITKSLLSDRDIDTSRVVVMNVVTIEEFRTKALQCVDKYLKIDKADRQPMMFVLDSLGMLSTEKEIGDALADKQVRDMTKSQLVKGAFRMLTLKLGQADVPLIVTNHTYDVIGAYVPTKEMGGGSGLKYAASTIIYLSKKKEKDGKEIIGNIIKAKTAKSRLSKENQQVEVRLYYDERGLDSYYGLLELGELGGLWKNVAGRYEIDGKKVYAKAILKDPEQYFTPEVLDKLDAIARTTFSYGGGDSVVSGGVSGSDEGGGD